MNKTIVKTPKEVEGYRVVQDSEEVLDALKNGETIARFEYGDSMKPMLVSGEYCILEPITKQPQVGDAVFCRVNGYLMTHMVWVVSNIADKPYYLIGGSNGSLYGWTNEVYAIAKGTNVVEQPPSYDKLARKPTALAVG